MDKLLNTPNPLKL